jgi:hypothetical protein
MDPNACMERILQAIRDGNRSEAFEAMEDLLGWLKFGGFPPRFSDEMAGARQVMPFHLSSGHSVHIQTVVPRGPDTGWELVEYNRSGDRCRSWHLAKQS